nr:hypothetical protein [Dyella flava]
MALKVEVVSDLMFPKTPLPNLTFAFAPFRGASNAACFDSLGERLFDQHPAHRIVPVLGGHAPYGMHVLGENDPRGDVKRMALLHHRDGVAQYGDAFCQQGAGPISEIDREEECAAGSLGPSITHIALRGGWTWVEVLFGDVGGPPTRIATRDVVARCHRVMSPRDV